MFSPKNTPAESHVSYGMDVLKKLEYEPLEWRRTAVFCNHSSLDRQGRHLLDVLNPTDTMVIPLIYIFNAPHWKGLSIPEETIWMDSAVIRYQQYPHLRFNIRDILSCDAILFDMQLSGVVDDPALSILQIAASLAQKHDLELIVCDRPPLTRVDTCQGPWHEGFELPYQYGLTSGELAHYFGTYFFPGLRLSVIPLDIRNRKDIPHFKSPYPVKVDTLLLHSEQGKYVIGLSLLQATNLYIETTPENLWFGSPSADPFFLKAKLADIHPAFGNISIRTVKNDTSAFQILSLDKVKLPEFYKITACLRLMLILYPDQILLDSQALARKTGNHEYGDLLLSHTPLDHFQVYWDPEYRTFYERMKRISLYRSDAMKE
ncbi:MAG: exo-beta-N-acetylmuramidase NamZ domain-containing protein [Fidelibacterota bacterium]